VPRPSLRDQIIDAAVATLHRQGFNGSSVQDITEAAHAPKGSFYNHFGSKEELAVAALERYWQRLEASLTLLDSKDLPPRERLARYFGGLNAAARKNGFRAGCMIGNLSAEMADQSPRVRNELASLLARWTKAIESCVRQAQADGSMRRDLDSRDAAAFLINAWEGAMLRSKADRNSDALILFERVVSTLFARS
jgi:TetR/AcrR family transcriptional regulator, transcriptional repressor for nem operon